MHTVQAIQRLPFALSVCKCMYVVYLYIHHQPIGLLKDKKKIQWKGKLLVAHCTKARHTEGTAQSFLSATSNLASTINYPHSLPDGQKEFSSPWHVRSYNLLLRHRANLPHGFVRGEEEAERGRWDGGGIGGCACACTRKASSSKKHFPSVFFFLFRLLQVISFSRRVIIVMSGLVALATIFSDYSK